MSIWLIEQSRDGGKTWEVYNPYHLYKKPETAHKKCATMMGWRSIFRVTEYKAVSE